MTFLELCQMVARESGTISGTLPLATTAQEGRLLKVVNWTRSAWTQIQNDRTHWRWMYDEFGDANCITSVGTRRYTPASWNIQRMRHWVIAPESPITLYLEATGQSDEGELSAISWAEFRRTYERGSHPEGRPIHVAVSPQNEICLGPTPDDVYRIRGEYYKAPQTLEADEDVPELPEHYHEVIGHYGLILLAEHDEGEYHTQVAYRRYSQLMSDIRRSELPSLGIGGSALA